MPPQGPIMCILGDEEMGDERTWKRKGDRWKFGIFYTKVMAQCLPKCPMTCAHVWNFGWRQMNREC